MTDCSQNCVLFIRRSSGCADRREDGNCLILHLLAILSIAYIVSFIPRLLINRFIVTPHRDGRDGSTHPLIATSVQDVRQAAAAGSVLARKPIQLAGRITSNKRWDKELHVLQTVQRSKMRKGLPYLCPTVIGHDFDGGRSFSPCPFTDSRTLFMRMPDSCLNYSNT